MSNDAVDRLLKLWDARNAGDGVNTLHIGRAYPQKTKSRVARVAGVLSLAAHAHELAREVRAPARTDVLLTQAPLVRAIYESAITVVWLHKEPEAATAWTHKIVRSRKAMRDEMGKTRAFQHVADVMPIPDEPPEAATKAAAAEAQNFWMIAERLGMSGAYAIYRMLCELTHPTVGAADHFLVATEDYEFGFRPHPDLSGWTDAFEWTVAACLLWAARCVDHLDGNAHRSELRQIGKDLGAPADVSFRSRVEVAEAKRRGRETVWRP